MKVEVYPNSQLYKDREELEALQLGAVQMLAPSVSKFGPLGVRKFEVFDLPLHVPGREVAREAWSRVRSVTGLFKLLEPKGITGLAYWFNGFKEFTANKPLKKLDDFKGMKIRIQSSKVLEGEIKALGAIPQVMAFSEVYTALQQGVVDGEENTPSNKYTQKMHEVQKHMTMSDHGVVMYAVVVNKKFWDGLPPDIRKSLERGDGRIDKVRVADREAGKRRRCRQDQGRQDDRDLRAAAGREGGMAQGDAAAVPAVRGRRRQGHAAGDREDRRAVRRRSSQLDAAIGRGRDRRGGHRCAPSTASSTTSRNGSSRASWRSRRSSFSFRCCTATPPTSPGSGKYTQHLSLTWAQELCIYLFIWMAKFGAAYGVRTGIHVGVDVLVRLLAPPKRRFWITFDLLAGAFFTGVIAVLGGMFVWRMMGTGQVSPDLELPMWIVYLRGAARLRAHVLPLSAGRLALPPHGRAALAQRTRASTAWTRRHARERLDHFHPADRC